MKKENAVAVNHSMSNQLNYFNLLGIEKDFDIDKEVLYKNFLELQKLYHPDKLINKPHIEKIASLSLASRINQAYETLNDDKKRAEYLLLLENIVINQEFGNNINPAPEMLIEILELSEDKDIEKIELLKEEAWGKFKYNYQIKNLKEAAQAIIKLQYLNKI